jgi:hypothetical protein
VRLEDVGEREQGRPNAERAMKKRPGPVTPPASPVSASIAARIGRLTAALGEPFGEDPRLASYATALAATRTGPRRCSTSSPSGAGTCGRWPR